MVKLITIAFSTLILFQSVNISFVDISKFNTLLQHAEFHQKAYGDSFMDFLAEHYGDTEFGHEADHEEHDDLPFKHNHQSCVHNTVTFTLQAWSFGLAYIPYSEVPLNFFYTESSSLFEKASVFQPPKFA